MMCWQFSENSRNYNHVNSSRYNRILFKKNHSPVWSTFGTLVRAHPHHRDQVPNEHTSIWQLQNYHEWTGIRPQRRRFVLAAWQRGRLPLADEQQSTLDHLREQRRRPDGMTVGHQGVPRQLHAHQTTKRKRFRLQEDPRATLSPRSRWRINRKQSGKGSSTGWVEPTNFTDGRYVHWQLVATHSLFYASRRLIFHMIVAFVRCRAWSRFNGCLSDVERLIMYDLVFGVRHRIEWCLFDYFNLISLIAACCNALVKSNVII